MNEYEKQTAFLRQCLRYAENRERQELEQGIAQNLRDDRCLRRAMWLMVLLMTLVLVGVGYGAVLVEGFFHNLSPVLFKLVAVLGLASLLSLVGFAGLRVGCRHKLNGRREHCRRLAAGLFELRLNGVQSLGGDRETEAVPTSGAVVASPRIAERTLDVTPGA